MDIAFAYILHHKILNEEKGETDNNSSTKYRKEENYQIVPDQIPISPSKNNTCPRCGQSIYFCNCPPPQSELNQ